MHTHYADLHTQLDPMLQLITTVDILLSKVMFGLMNRVPMVAVCNDIR